MEEESGTNITQITLDFIEKTISSILKNKNEYSYELVHYYVERNSKQLVNVLMNEIPNFDKDNFLIELTNEFTVTFFAISEGGFSDIGEFMKPIIDVIVKQGVESK
jgi:hypothetical protein